MKAILDGKLYDTEKSEKLCDFDYHTAYRTKNGTLFTVFTHFDENGKRKEIIDNKDQEKIKGAIGLNCPDIYIKIFGEVEEA